MCIRDSDNMPTKIPATAPNPATAHHQNSRAMDRKAEWEKSSFVSATASSNAPQDPSAT